MGGGGSRGKKFATMMLHLWFCNMTTTVVLKKLNFDLLTPSPRSERGLQTINLLPCCCIWWFPLISYATWPCSEKVEFWPINPIPRVREGSASKIFATMLLHLVIPFNLICNMTAFWKSWILTYWPQPQGQLTQLFVMGFGRNSNSFKLLWLSLLPAQMKGYMLKIHSKMKALECSQHFSHYKSMEIFTDVQGQLTL